MGPHDSALLQQTSHAAAEQPDVLTRNATLDTLSPFKSQMALRPSFDSRATDPRPRRALTFIPAPKPTNNPTTPLLALTNHVQAQSTQARHLFTQSSHLLSAIEREWIETTITDTESTTQEILRLTESFRVEEAVRNGRVGVKSQLRWLLYDSRKAREKRERLVLCHTSLMGVLTKLQGLSLHGSKDEQRESLQGDFHHLLGGVLGGEGETEAGVTGTGPVTGPVRRQQCTDLDLDLDPDLDLGLALTLDSRDLVVLLGI
ncbi:hypothetical protein FE257_005329 [Aspergillus nanangensis]|uniref:Uncharacterized protein n=1 Tax=Aspergillus nanangensis TaxID=2582783 RepID=A0AAD4CBB9_ASPNN|nr:hypothetical protein FE257_005329 [Aspergillus nanangensis]